MCGRFTLTAEAPAIRKAFSLPDEILKRWKPRYNIAPGQVVSAITMDRGKRYFEPLVWGLIPSWRKEAVGGARLINARAETCADKPSFRGPFRNARCLVLADGFYEWCREGGQKIPHYIRLKSGEPFAFAGIVSRWAGADGSEIPTCAVLTCEANTTMTGIHNRMPVILTAEAKDQWIDRLICDKNRLQNLLKPFDSERMQAHQVSLAVNSSAGDSPEFVKPQAVYKPSEIA